MSELDFLYGNNYGRPDSFFLANQIMKLFGPTSIPYNCNIREKKSADFKGGNHSTKHPSFTKQYLSIGCMDLYALVYV